ncbi:MAG: hypothetical protein GY943_19145 [Chloroflexi bacterium]|nr:hypothetical protein [Chloroflexota bacterium]
MNSHKVVLSALATLTLLFLGAAAMSLWRDLEIASDPGLLKSGPSQPKYVPQFLDIPVIQTGMIAVRTVKLRQLSFQIDTFSPNSISLTRDGEAVPFIMDPQIEDGTLYFYGEANRSDFEPTAVYRLQVGQGTTIQTRDAAPTGEGTAVGTFHHRWQQPSSELAQVSSDNKWLGQRLLAPHQLDITLEQLQASGGPAQLIIQPMLNTEANANPDHHLNIAFNNQEIASQDWNGLQQEQIVIDVPENVLLPLSNNTITISTSEDTGAIAESVYINSVDLYYERTLALRGQPLIFQSDAENVTLNINNEKFLILDITDPSAPVQLTNMRQNGDEITFAGSGTGARYMALYPYTAQEPILRVSPNWNSILKQSERGADYIAIVPELPEFLEAVQPLLDYRQEQGLRVTAVSLDQIYDEFAAGHHSPTAIRDFLAFAATNWQPPAPKFILLVGDASIDTHNQTNGKNSNLIPTHLYPNNNDSYQTSDTWFVMLDADATPDIAIGRFPAQTASQVAEMVAKTINYEQRNNQNWQSRALFVADDETQFNTTSNQLAQNLEANGYDIYKLAMTENDNIHDEIIGALSEGVGLLSYTGHGQEQYWGDEATFHAQDGAMLTDSGHYPILTTFTSNNGAFGSPTIDSLAESLLWVENGGIVAAIALSDYTNETDQLHLADQFYQQLFLNPSQTIGEALMDAKTAVSTDPSLTDTIHAIHLLGDPALVLQRP